VTKPPTSEPRPFYSTGGLNVETYDTRTATPPGEIEFYIDRARRSGGTVLELACGTGRVTWPIARAGVPIVGLDLAQGMLDRAESKRSEEDAATSARARFVAGDMTTFELAERFALAIIPFRAFLMLLTPELQRSALQRVHAHLEPHGRLIIDIFDPRFDLLAQQDFVPRREVPSFAHPVTGNTISVNVLSRHNDQVNQRASERWRFTEVDPEGKTIREEDEIIELRWIYRYEMRYLLELCGYEVEEEFSDYLGGAAAYGKEQVWVAIRAER
jgi:SAM-dependent methyltransferase